MHRKNYESNFMKWYINLDYFYFMLHFFSKSTFLIDTLGDTPDIHCHILPGIDDGSPDLNTSKIIVQKYIDLGFKKLYATPHTMGEIYPNTPETIRQALSQVETLGMDIDITAASEYMLDEVFEEHLTNDNLLFLKRNYVLIELSYFQPPNNLEQLIFQITSKGHIPILAHPERYAFYYKKLDVFRSLKAKGCLLQLDALSLSKHYGASVQKMAFQLLDDGLYDYIGTDTHRLEHLEKISEIKVKNKNLVKITSLARNNQITFS